MQCVRKESPAGGRDPTAIDHGPWPTVRGACCRCGCPARGLPHVDVCAVHMLLYRSMASRRHVCTLHGSMEDSGEASHTLLDKGLWKRWPQRARSRAPGGHHLCPPPPCLFLSAKPDTPACA